MQEKWDCWQWKEYSTPQHSGWAFPLSDSGTNNVLQQYVFIKTRFPPHYILSRYLRREVSIVSYSLCIHFFWIPGVFFSSFNAQYKYAFNNWIRRGRITWLFCWKKKSEQEQHLSTQNARFQNSEVHKFSFLLSFRSFFDAATTKRWQI